MQDRTPVQLAALTMGVVFVLVGIAGFIPGITTNYDELGFAGPDSEAQLIGLFQVSALHNLVHALFGIAGLVGARTIAGARGYLIGGGVIYLLLAVYGLVIDLDSPANFVPLDSADNLLHIFLGVVMVGAGVALTRGRTTARH